MGIIDVPEGGRHTVAVKIGYHEGYSVTLRDHEGLPSWVEMSSDLPLGHTYTLTPSWDETKRIGSEAVRSLVIVMPDDHPVAPGASTTLRWRIRDPNRRSEALPVPEPAPETPQEPAVATLDDGSGGSGPSTGESPQTASSDSSEGVSPMVGGWMVDDVEVEETAPWRNKMTIDLVCDDSGVKHGRGYGMNAMLARPVDRGYEVVPTVVGYAPEPLKLEKGDDTDRHIELVLRNVPLFWGEKHELHLSPRGERTHITLPFVLTEAMKQTDIQEIQRLEARKVTRAQPIERRPEITGKVKLLFQYDFNGRDAWFYVSNSNVHIFRSERLCRRNDEGRCAIMAYLKHGLNKVQVCPYEPDTQRTGRAVTIEVHNPY